MRRADREITDFNKIADVIERCQVIRLGLSGDEYPYIVPLSFGYEAAEGKITLYFHGAKKGLKHELITRDNRACVEMDIFHNYAETPHGPTTEYESVIGFGTVCRVTGKEAVKGINLLLAHCGCEALSGEKCIAMGVTRVYKITLERFTGKQRRV